MHLYALWPIWGSAGDSSECDDDKIDSNDIEARDLQEQSLKYKELMFAYLEALKKISVLEKQNKISEVKLKQFAKENDDIDEVEDEDILKEKIIESKHKGYKRTGPQSEAIRLEKNKSKETKKCPICDKSFLSEPEFNKHVSTHTDDGDWTCNECPFQTNSKSNLNNHIQETKHLKNQIHHGQTEEEKNDGDCTHSCPFCEETFMTDKDLLIHRKDKHRSFKPCRNLPDCLYKSNCFYNHNKVSDNVFLCYECGHEFTTKPTLMDHRMQQHSTKTYQLFINN